MTLETPNRVRAVAVLLLLRDDEGDLAFSFRGREGFLTLATVDGGADTEIADMTLQHEVNNDEGIILATADDPANVDVGAWITPEHSARGVPALDDIPANHACVEAIVAPKIAGWRICVTVFGVLLPGDVTTIPGEPLTPPP